MLKLFLFKKKSEKNVTEGFPHKQVKGTFLLLIRFITSHPVTPLHRQGSRNCAHREAPGCIKGKDTVNERADLEIVFGSLLQPCQSWKCRACVLVNSVTAQATQPLLKNKNLLFQRSFGESR